MAMYRDAAFLGPRCYRPCRHLRKVMQASSEAERRTCRLLSDLRPWCACIGCVQSARSKVSVLYGTKPCT